MPRTVKFVPSSTATTTQVAVESIPQDVRDEVEEIYAALKANPAGRMRAEFDTVDEARTYILQVQSYCAQRTVDGVAAPLRYRKSPTRKLPATVAEFRITDPLTENEQNTEDIRTATDAVNTAAAPAETPAKSATSRKR